MLWILGLLFFSTDSPLCLVKIFARLPLRNHD